MVWLALWLSAGAVAAEDVAEEVLVLGDPYARFDDTRWHIETQVGMPWPVPLYARRNHMAQLVAFDVRLVIHCDKTLTLGRVREVECGIEDVALSFAPFGRTSDGVQQLLDDSVADLQGATLQLQVDARGRIADLDIEGIEANWRQETVRLENLRQIVRSAVSGFHLKLPQPPVPGQVWVERDVPIAAIPAFRSVAGSTSLVDAEGELADASSTASGGNFGLGDGSSDGATETQTASVESRDFGSGRAQFDAMTTAAARGVAELAHRVDRYKGSWVLQSRGNATVELGDDAPLTYQGMVEGVGIIHDDRGWITERVWTVILDASASNLLSDGQQAWTAWMTGRLRQLDDDEQVELGQSLLTRPPGDKGLPPGVKATKRAQERSDLPGWLSRIQRTQSTLPAVDPTLSPADAGSKPKKSKK